MEKTMVTRTKILIVDDIELNRAILSELFKDTYDILEAENGVEAIELLATHFSSVSIILLDLIMPVMDGFTVLKTISNYGWSGTIPVVIITAETSESTMQKVYEMGVTDIISKPFSPNIIRQRINNVVEQYKYRTQLELLVEDQMFELRNKDKKMRENSAKIIDILSAVIEFKNSESVNHIRNIRVLTHLLLEKLALEHKEYELTEELIAVISEASAMHDIGKVAIPDQILNKPGKLTFEEFEIMKTHTLRGCEMLEKLSTVQYLDYYDYCYQICRHHHERWDGKGYPDGIAGDSIPIWAQVVSLADVFDALTSNRVYKEAYSCETAISMILEGQCGVFNPQLIECFLDLVPFLKNGIQVIINQKQTAGTSKNDNVKPAIKTIMSTEGLKEIPTRTLHLLELERQKYHIMSELSGEILFDYDATIDRLSFSEKFQIITKQEPIITQLTERIKSGSLLHSDDIPIFYQTMKLLTFAKPTCRLELRINFGGLGFTWYEMYLHSIWDSEHETKCLGYMGKLINIHSQKQENLKLQGEANEDFLTGIANRKALYTQISHLIAREPLSMGALFFLDVDDFKKINDTFGHLFGDTVLKRVSSVLQKYISKTDLIGRVGGDEFVIFINGYSDEASLFNKIKSTCEKLHSDLNNCEVSASIGIACYPKHGTDFNILLHRADQTLYKAKLRGKNQCQLYSED